MVRQGYPAHMPIYWQTSYHCDMILFYGLDNRPDMFDMECMDKEQLTPENAISKIRWYTDMLEKVLKG